MKAMKKILSVLLASVMLLALLTACGGDKTGENSGNPGNTSSGDDGKVYELSLSTHDPATSNKTIFFQEWADQIKEASGGRLNITIYSAGALAAGTAALDALRTNVCDIAWIYPPYFSGQFPLSEVISQPIGVSSVPQGVQVLYGLYEKYPELQEELSEFVPLMMHTNPTNKICSIDGHPITSVADLKGLTFRASAGTPSDLQMCIRDRVEGLWTAQTPVMAIHMGGAPVEPLPGVRVILHLGVAQQVEKPFEGRQLIAHQSPAVVGSSAGGDRLLAVGVLDSPDLPGHQAQRLVPGGPAVARLATVLCISVLPVRGLHKIFPDQRVQQTIIGVAFVLVLKPQRRHGHPAGRGKGLSPGLDGPPLRIVLP